MELIASPSAESSGDGDVLALYLNLVCFMTSDNTWERQQVPKSTLFCKLVRPFINIFPQRRVIYCTLESSRPL